jgi:AcrR family transcriptional regulator
LEGVMTKHSSAVEVHKRPRPYHHGDLASALQQTTLAIIGERGVGGVTLSEAARRAGVSHAAAYRHFAGLPGLLVATAESCYARWSERRAGRPFETPDPQGEIFALLADYFELARDDPATFSLIFDSGIQKSSMLIAEWGRRDYQKFLLMISRATSKPADDCHIVAQAIMATVLGHVRMSMDGMLSTTMDQAAEAAAAAVRMLLAGFNETRCDS